MAERDYMQGKGVTPIQEMTTRQLRKYIRERAEEAQERLDSIQKDKRLNIEDMSRAFQDQLSYVQNFGHGRSGGIMKDTSRMSKEQMAEYAYAIRDLNMLDTESKYSRDLEYKENKDRYEKFIKERTSGSNINKGDKAYWSKFLTEKNNVSKRGYDEYKNFVNFLRSIDEVMAKYGYETVKDKYYDETDPEMQALVADLLLEVYEENSGLGLEMGDLVDEFNRRLEEKKAEIKESNTEVPEAPKRTGQKKPSNKQPTVNSQESPRKPKGKKLKSKKSKQNVKTKTAGKMKNGSIREKPTTKKL